MRPRCFCAPERAPLSAGGRTLVRSSVSKPRARDRSRHFAKVGGRRFDAARVKKPHKPMQKQDVGASLHEVANLDVELFEIKSCAVIQRNDRSLYEDEMEERSAG